MENIEFAQYKTYFEESTDALLAYYEEKKILNSNGNTEDVKHITDYTNRKIKEAKECLNLITKEEIYNFDIFENYFYLFKNDDRYKFFNTLSILEYCNMWEDYLFSINETLFKGVNYDFPGLGGLEDETFKCARFAQMEGLKAKSVSREMSNQFPEEKHLSNDYSKDEIDPATDINIHLLKYLSENFIPARKNFTDLSKFNHIYFYLFPIPDGDNYNQNRAEHNAYKLLIKKTFGFDYANSQIKVYNDKYFKQLDELTKSYRDSKK